MLHQTFTGGVKAPEIKISRPVFALLITASVPFASLANEKITIEVERSQGTNTPIANAVPLRRVLGISAHGAPAVVEIAGNTRAVVVLAPGAVKLGENESLKVQLFDLDSTKTYTVSSIEGAQIVPSPFMFEVKTMSGDDVAKKFDIPGYSIAHIAGFNNVNQLRVTYKNGQTVNYEPAELKAIAELDDPFYLIQDGSVVGFPSTEIIFNCEQMIAIEVIKSGSNPVYLTLKA